jgi:UPF0271 protein
VIEISCDLGEATSSEAIDIELQLWEMIDAANVACGGHVGDSASMSAAAALASRRGVILGAHPSYPDRAGFGRKTMRIEAAALRESLVGQISALREIALQHNVRLQRVKPHGALYNDAHGDESLAAVIVEACLRVDPDLAVVCAAGAAVERVASRRGVRVVREAFADRRYLADGSLQPRSEEGSLLLDADVAAQQAARLARSGEVEAAGGEIIKVPFDTLCVHGDMERSVERLRVIVELLRSAGSTAASKPAR